LKGVFVDLQKKKVKGHGPKEDSATQIDGMGKSGIRWSSGENYMGRMDGRGQVSGPISYNVGFPIKPNEKGADSVQPLTKKECK